MTALRKAMDAYLAHFGKGFSLFGGYWSSEAEAVKAVEKAIREDRPIATPEVTFTSMSESPEAAA